AALDSDAASVDVALKAHGGAVNAGIKPDRWDALKHQLAAIEKSVPPAPASAAPLSASPAASGEPASASASAPVPGTAAALPAPAPEGAAAASPPAAEAPDNGGPT